MAKDKVVPPEPDNNLRFEIGHVLFIDIVGYSKLLIEEQKERLHALTAIVLATPQVRASTDEQLVRLPTGDGMALVFHHSAEEPARCALEIAEALRKHPEIPVRMGIHSGPVSEVTDVSGRTNIAGAGINMAQRVMDCGDAGHILLSQHVADDLVQYRQWAPRLRDLGECEVKHGVRLRLVNLYAEPLGNPEPPEKFRQIAAAASTASPLAKPKRVPWHEVVIVAVLLAAGLAYFLFHRSGPKSVAVADKSIAVLPFANLSSDKENAYFADGVQDEILTNLARIADLKVISRTSVMQYASGAPRNLTEIGQALKVAHVLEGSVQRAEHRVRVTAQLIDARTDAHLWAQRYDGDLSDVFAIQSEIAQKIADQLQAVLSPKERTALADKPTSDLAAYDLYLRAIQLGHGRFAGEPEVREKVRLLEDATSRDPSFVLALCALARADLEVYWFNFDHSDARLAEAKKAIDAAERLKPDVGEGHVAKALLHYWGSRDYAPALAELHRARGSLPNDASVLFTTALIERRQAQSDEAIRDFEDALKLDPQNAEIVTELVASYLSVKRHPDAIRVLDEALRWNPNDFAFAAIRASVDVARAADFRATEAVLASETAKTADSDYVAELRTDLAFNHRVYAAAERALAEYKAPYRGGAGFNFPKELTEGIIARQLGDSERAERALLAARERAAANVAAQPDDAKALVVLGQVDAFLGRKDEASREGERATELLTVAKDAVDGPLMLVYLAGIYAQTGQPDRSLDVLEHVAPMNWGPDYGDLKLGLIWDPLRGDPRFEKIVASLAPKEAK